MRILIERFNLKIEKLESGCWIFTGCKNGKNYGVFNNPYERTAHRFSWLINNGEIPKNLMVLHTCDNPPCIRIDHLWLGTAKDNTLDMVKKNRSKVPEAPKRGEDNINAKITNEQAFQIVKLIEDGKTTTEIIKELSIGRSIINDIRCRKSRKYLNFKKPEHKYPKYFKNCLVCSEEYKLKLYRFNSAKFCSFKCYWKSLTGKECLK